MNGDELGAKVCEIKATCDQNKAMVEKLYNRTFGEAGSPGLVEDVAKIKTTMAFGVKALGAIGLVTVIELGALLFKILQD